MAIIRKKLPTKNFTKSDNTATFDMSISHAAYRLYSLMCVLQSGRQFNDAYFIKIMGISNKSMWKYKKELIDKDYILVDKEGVKHYFLYVGNSEYPASKVKKEWEDADKESNIEGK